MDKALSIDLLFNYKFFLTVMPSKKNRYNCKITDKTPPFITRNQQKKRTPSAVYIRVARRLGTFSSSFPPSGILPRPSSIDGGGGEAASLERACASLADMETRTSGLRSLWRRGRAPLSSRERRSSALWWRAAESGGSPDRSVQMAGRTQKHRRICQGIDTTHA